MSNNKNVFQPHFLASENRYVIGFGGIMSKEEASAEVDRLNGKPEIRDITFRLYYQEGEYLSGYTLNGDDAKELVKLGLAHYVSGWGYLVSTPVIEALGTIFTHKAAVEYSQPTRQAKLAKERSAKAAQEALFSQAKSTGQPVLIRSYSDECNDPREECDLDNITEYAMPDGSIKTTRSHTW